MRPNSHKSTQIKHEKVQHRNFEIFEASHDEETNTDSPEEELNNGRRRDSSEEEDTPVELVQAQPNSIPIHIKVIGSIYQHSKERCAF